MLRIKNADNLELLNMAEDRRSFNKNELKKRL